MKWIVFELVLKLVFPPYCYLEANREQRHSEILEIRLNGQLGIVHIAPLNSLTSQQQDSFVDQIWCKKKMEVTEVTIQALFCWQLLLQGMVPPLSLSCPVSPWPCAALSRCPEHCLSSGPSTSTSEHFTALVAHTKRTWPRLSPQSAVTFWELTLIEFELAWKTQQTVIWMFAFEKSTVVPGAGVQPC